jgi:hypothetical protein
LSVLIPLLHRLTGWDHFPIILVEGNTIGSWHELNALHENGELAPVLIKAAGSDLVGKEYRERLEYEGVDEEEEEEEELKKQMQTLTEIEIEEDLRMQEEQEEEEEIERRRKRMQDNDVRRLRAANALVPPSLKQGGLDAKKQPPMDRRDGGRRAGRVALRADSHPAARPGVVAHDDDDDNEEKEEF